jgi:5-methylthioadenosine/S-adenosylhomocysteine deaminase
MKTLFKNAVIMTADDTNTCYERGYIFVEGDTITAVGQEWSAVEPTADQVIDVQGKWIMPGWVNTHGHAGMTILRGYADDLPLQEWLEQKMWPMEGQFTADTVRWATSLAVVEMLKTGTTCFLDMYDHMDIVARVVEESGIRAVLARGVTGLCSAEEQIRKLEQATAFATEWNGQAGGRITTMMSPHAAYTCPPDYVRKIVARAAEHRLPVHIHLSETAREVEQNVKDYGKRPVAHLEELGVFDSPTLVAHAVHLTDEEIDILKKYDVKISHNPTSNLKLGSGVARVKDLLQNGFEVSIGTDSVASNNNLDMFQEVRLAALIQKGVLCDPTAVAAQTALKMGTQWGGKALFLKDTGQIAKGYKADFIIINPYQAHLQPFHEPVAHIIYSASGHDVEDVYVNGKQVVKNGQCLYIDEEKVIAEANRVFQVLTRY